ncbi:outer membrane beta-barrel protein [Spirosoma utsteinense]|uniref:Outer membrane protein beta-barrel domain-containing protein n=1 Tax=Spirosoma utsteinense TaxID=2585773 RepID=A0ABR6WFR0_9BACT|nr:outer membrane beta-barrel protein [Spirosoma utsteinense]MBC3795391.1 hypothetical protein [Spirosoma utsteinense]
MKSIAFLLISMLLGNLSARSQSVSQFSIQAGYLYSTPTFTRTTYYLIGLPDFEPKPGFYAGISYEHSLSPLVTSQIEFTYQQKGHTVKNAFPDEKFGNAFRYLSITPMVGITPIKNLRFLIGPQINWLIDRSINGAETSQSKSANRRFEFGLMGRGSYQFYRVGLSVSYFEGLTAYYKSNFFYLTNQNWQLGLHYQLDKK